MLIDILVFCGRCKLALECCTCLSIQAKMTPSYSESVCGRPAVFVHTTHLKLRTATIHPKLSLYVTNVAKQHLPVQRKTSTCQAGAMSRSVASEGFCYSFSVLTLKVTGY